MAIQKLESSLVLVAKSVNVSIFKPNWFAKVGILKDDEILEGYEISENLVRIPTAEYEIIITPDRLQWRPSTDNETPSVSLQKSLGRIISKLPHTPFWGIGFNQAFLIHPEQATFQKWQTDRFRAGFADYNGFGEAGSQSFGAIYAFNLYDYRVSFTMTPAEVREGGEDEKVQPGDKIMHIKSNFHRDLSEENRETEILAMLDDYDRLSKLSLDYVQFLHD